MFDNLWISFCFTLAAALAWLRINNFFVHRGWINSRSSRKIIHIGTGPIFVLCWLLFPEHPAARFLAAIIPLAITIQFALIGTGIINDPDSVQAMSRSGERSEILKGPLLYGIVFVIVTLIFWKENLTGIVALMVLCGGDGMADLIGTKFQGAKIPWSINKTVIGSLGMLICGWLLAVAVSAVFVQAGLFIEHFPDYFFSIFLISLAGTFVETLPFRDIDNLTVTAAALLCGLALKI